MVGVAHAPLPGFALFLNLRGLCLTGEGGGGGLASHSSLHRHLSPHHLQARTRQAVQVLPIGWQSPRGGFPVSETQVPGLGVGPQAQRPWASSGCVARSA